MFNFVIKFAFDPGETHLSKLYKFLETKLKELKVEDFLLEIQEKEVMVKNTTKTNFSKIFASALKKFPGIYYTYEDEVALKWYAVNVPSGRENTFSIKIRNIVNGDDNFGEVFLPMVKETAWDKLGNEKVLDKVMYPGYIFVETMHIGRLKNILQSLDSKIKPSILQETLSNDDIEKIKNRKEEDCFLSKKHSYSIGDPVIISAAKFNGLNGIVEEIHEDEPGEELKIAISMFGRCIYARVGFSDVKKIER
ncbi:transcription termination/antitermination protein NusG [Candidatus Nesciobacter abundans]|uniref:NusG-like N-terminal domain-containing protein n=1 Tax=Candidatus Nesciobacter abundans TaxID=2601668 RepID=A0A5C0UI93_9PROT|nr:transcription termination/antitermination NusG family protein [Candidatus Nesciobacter abundans]QEK39233.1 hypothetical protein FZC36_02240 [Candidatus Nesciobacter abundans]